jgi:DNA-binding NtrC family response regulator
MNETILIVDDDASVVTSLALLLKQAGYLSLAASTPAEAIERLRVHRVDLVIQDMNFSRRTTGDEGVELLREIQRLHAGLPVVLMTAWGSIGLAVRGMQAGASDFITKPWTNQQIVQSVRTSLGLAAAGQIGRQSEPPTREDLDERFDLRGIVGRDPGLLRVLDLATRVASTDASVLITGESGTGKEAIAEAIHRNSARSAGPFVKVNLGGISASLFESEMFGHTKGAFTDAHQSRRGRFEVANGGTVLLDEIGDLDTSSQVKLLRVLQDRTYEVLGSSQTRTVDVRVISATNRNLTEMVASGQFREDLLYRINLITVHVPALRGRQDDIPALAVHFLEQASKAYGRDGLSIEPAALRWLRSQPWPGNIRELKNVVERALLVSRGDVVTVADFAEHAGARAGAGRSDALPDVGSMTIDEIERAMILKSLRHHDGNVSRVADSLGLSRAALYRRFEKYGIEP